MTSPSDAQDRVLDTLREHFGRTDAFLEPEQVAQMAGLDLTTTQNALRVLWKMHKIEGVDVAEFPYPVRITDVIW